MVDGFKGGVMKYWYKFFYEECVLCGCNRQWKERQFTKKPKDQKKRYHYRQFMCQCAYD
jgi:hypothetical protein